MPSTGLTFAATAANHEAVKDHHDIAAERRISAGGRKRSAVTLHTATNAKSGLYARAPKSQ